MRINRLFNYSRSQRQGIFWLLLLIIGLQIVYFFWTSKLNTNNHPSVLWADMQKEVDSLKNRKEKKENSATIYPFNPNFITDYKGYNLGMTVVEIDKLLEFRKQGKYVNSAAEFQQVTGISDSLLTSISPYFKFPDWVTNRKERTNIPYNKKDNREDVKRAKTDINLASQEDLIKVYGIGQALSARIIKEREKLGAFFSMNQLDFVWGLSPEVVENLKKHFDIINPVEGVMLNVNNCTTKQLADFPYFNYALAREIVTFRTMNNGIRNIDDLTKIKDFPVEKIDFIALYLEF
ncbi:MAG: helix-hairpin-helix domain-containing protein [Flavobacteriaceae bacterium]|jgi:DNA uptake protein ComE-like DNA-binding protein|nr:helix-hairpin-helix domain-containing protein [Flavobacteriaceae bacterium]